MEFLKLTCIGLVMGMTLVIPGLSAGTMAIVFNVYDRLIGVIVPNVRKVLDAWKFWLPLAIGGVAGILLFVKAISILYEHYEIPTMMFFIGLIAGSLPLVYSRVKQEHSALPSLPSAICLILALAVMIAITVSDEEVKNSDEVEQQCCVFSHKGTKDTEEYLESQTLCELCAFVRDENTELTPGLFGMLFLAGVFAAAALIIPGISGAFVLLVMGYYFTIVQAVRDMNVILLMPVFLGAAIGIFLGASLVRLLLKKAPRETYGAVFGLVAGSIIFLFSKVGGFGDGVTIVYSANSFLVGAAISFFFGRRQSSATAL